MKTLIVRHAWHSAKAAEWFGEYVYESLDESRFPVTVTAVGVSKDEVERSYLYPDRRYLGLVGRFLRKKGGGNQKRFTEEEWWKEMRAKT